jgi:hypothetical protein
VFSNSDPNKVNSTSVSARTICDAATVMRDAR